MAEARRSIIAPMIIKAMRMYPNLSIVFILVIEAQISTKANVSWFAAIGAVELMVYITFLLKKGEREILAFFFGS